MSGMVEWTDEMLAAVRDLRARGRNVMDIAEPLIGPISSGGGPGSIELLQEIIEELAASSGGVPQYRKEPPGTDQGKGA